MGHSCLEVAWLTELLPQLDAQDSHDFVEVRIPRQKRWWFHEILDALDEWVLKFIQFL